MDQIQRLAELIKASKHCVVFTGAGMSTESGLPDFRSSMGLWQGRNPMLVASIDALYRDTQNCQEFYRTRFLSQEAVEPNEGHYVLARMQQHGYVKSVITQNVDGLHARAGSTDIAELHGSIASSRCDACSKPFPGDYLRHVQLPALCPDCGGIVRPDIVLFGEHLPEDDWRKAKSEVASTDLLLVIGTSLAVSPANNLFYKAKENGAKTAVINRERISVSADIFIESSAAVTLKELAQYLF